MTYVREHAVDDVEEVMLNCSRFSKTKTAKVIFTMVIFPYNEKGLNWN
jgi:hypothetical protein